MKTIKDGLISLLEIAKSGKVANDDNEFALTCAFLKIANDESKHPEDFKNQHMLILAVHGARRIAELENENQKLRAALEMLS